MKSLIDFIIESNTIEDETSENINDEVPIYEWYLSNDLNEESTKEFHNRLFTVRAKIMKNSIPKKYLGVYRDEPVWIAGRECSSHMLDGRMYDFWNDFLVNDFPDIPLAYQNHKAFEEIHPFIDGNGRVGRAIWLHQMGGRASLGFLHQWYYQSLL